MASMVIKPLPKSLFAVTHVHAGSSVSLKMNGVMVDSFPGRKEKKPSRKRKTRVKSVLVRKNADWNF